MSLSIRAQSRANETRMKMVKGTGGPHLSIVTTATAATLLGLCIRQVHTESLPPASIVASHSRSNCSPDSGCRPYPHRIRPCKLSHHPADPWARGRTRERSSRTSNSLTLERFSGSMVRIPRVWGVPPTPRGANFESCQILWRTGIGPKPLDRLPLPIVGPHHLPIGPPDGGAGCSSWEPP